MPRSCIPALAFLIAVAASLPLHADLKISIQQTDGRATTTRTDYYKGQLWRSDREGGTYSVFNSANHRSLTVDTLGRQYSAATLLPAPPPDADPDQTFVVESETKDTGEQRPMFGHTAHHFVTTERRHTEYRDKPPSEIQQAVTDGWYLDIPGRFAMLSRIGAVAYIAVGDRAAMPKIAFKVTGLRPQGLPVWEKSPDRLLEVTALSEAPPDPKLFESPSDFRRVSNLIPRQHLSWSDMLHLHWQQFLNWLSSF